MMRDNIGVKETIGFVLNGKPIIPGQQQQTNTSAIPQLTIPQGIIKPEEKQPGK